MGGRRAFGMPTLAMLHAMMRPCSKVESPADGRRRVMQKKWDYVLRRCSHEAYGQHKPFGFDR
jgi:hypothetical protein